MHLTLDRQCFFEGGQLFRCEELARDLPGRTGREREQTQAQVAILFRRARMIRLSITLAALSALLASALIITLFLTALLQWESGLPASLIFIACMSSLFASLVAFICDINLSLHALKLELESTKPDLE